MRHAIFSSRHDFPAGILQLGYSADPAVTRCGPLSRSQYIIHYVISGRGRFNGLPVGAGEGFLIYPGQMAEYHPEPEEPWEFLWIIAIGDEMRRYMAECSADPVTQIFSYDFIGEAESLREHILKNNGAIVSPFACTELLARLMKHHDKPSDAVSDEPNWALIAREYLNSGISRRITVAELTSMLGISQPYLYRVFKAAWGVSPKQYLTERRVREAKRLLTSTELRIWEVGSAVGCDDVLLFSKFFTRQTGMSPSAYREQHKEEMK